MGRWGAYDADGGCCGHFGRLTEAWLLLHIFSRLDLEDMLRLRAVCKSWYDALHSPEFIHQHYTPPRDPWALLRVRRAAPPSRDDDDDEVYDYSYFDYTLELESHVELWRPCATIAHHKKAAKRKLQLGPLGSRFVGLCASNGLACGILMQNTAAAAAAAASLDLAVGNPITNEWKQLPPAPLAHDAAAPRPAYLPIAMEAHPVSGAYQVALLYEDEDHVYSLQYRSESGCWEHGPDLLMNAQPSSAGSRLQGTLFYLGWDDVLAAYDLQRRAWSHVVVRRPVCPNDEDEEWSDWSLSYIGAFRYEGKCFLASLLFHEVEEGMFEDVGAAIWELDEARLAWVLVSRMSCRDLFGPNWCLTEGNKDMTVKLVGDTAFISSFYRRDCYGAWAPVAYHLALRRWYSYAPPATNGAKPRLDYDVECAYVVLPSLTAKP